VNSDKGQDTRLYARRDPRDGGGRKERHRDTLKLSQDKCLQTGLPGAAKGRPGGGFGGIATNLCLPVGQNGRGQPSRKSRMVVNDVLGPPTKRKERDEVHYVGRRPKLCRGISDEAGSKFAVLGAELARRDEGKGFPLLLGSDDLRLRRGYQQTAGGEGRRKCR
jgi:hypothetical protein